KGSEVENQVTAYIPVDVTFIMNQVVNYAINFGTGNGGYDDGGNPIINSKDMIQFDTNFTDWADETPIDPTPPTPPTPTSNVPDKAFADFLVTAGYVEADTEKPGNYVVTAKGLALTELSIASDPDEGVDVDKIESIVGIELFPELEAFMVVGTKVASIDLSKNSKLKMLAVMNTPLLKSIKATNLGSLDESVMIQNADELRSLDLSGSTVESIQIGSAPLLGSNISLPNLSTLKGFTYITSGLTSFDLDVLPSTLETLSFHSNRLSELNITRFTNLTFLECGAQTSDGSISQTLNLTLTAAQRVQWDEQWSKQQVENADVNPIPVP
ncbi:MAG: hypothetical protein ACRCZY_12550, partial [Phocaeicola sp.]